MKRFLLNSHPAQRFAWKSKHTHRPRVHNDLGLNPAALIINGTLVSGPNTGRRNGQCQPSVSPFKWGGGGTGQGGGAGPKGVGPGQGFHSWIQHPLVVGRAACCRAVLSQCQQNLVVRRGEPLRVAGLSQGEGDKHPPFSPGQPSGCSRSHMM